MKSWAKKLQEMLTRRWREIPWSTRAQALICVVLAAAFGSEATLRYLNRVAFADPIATARAALGFAPKLDPRLRLVLLDDRSLARLGRLPTFSEWAQVANTLFAAGFKKAFLLDVFALEASVGELDELKIAGELYVGAVVSATGKNDRTAPLATVPPSLLAPGSEAPKAAQHAYLPAAGIRERVAGLGHMNLEPGNQTQLAFRADGTKKLPHLATRVLDPVAADRLGRFAHGGLVELDLPDVGSVLAASLPLAAFFEKDGKVRSSLSEKMREKLAGGEIALLATEAYTGARFIETPLGLLQSYFSTASLASALLHGKLVFEVFDPRLAVFPTFALFLLALRRRPARTKLCIWGASVGATVAIACVALLGFGVLLPAVGLVVTCTALYLSHAAFDVVALLGEKLALRRDLEMGQLVQTLLLPQSKDFEAYGWSIKIVFRPQGLMSGDWFQTFVSPPDPNVQKPPFVVLAIGDVVGKGPSAALVTALIAGAWADWHARWSSDDEGASLAAFAAGLGETIFRTLKGKQNSTLSIALLTEASAYLLVAGAPPWIRWNAGSGMDAARVKSPQSSVIGMSGVRRQTYQSTCEKLGEGEFLVAYTDGVIDGFKGANKLVRELGKLPKPDASQAFTALEGAIAKAGAGTTLPDDFTLIMIRRGEIGAVAPRAEAS